MTSRPIALGLLALYQLAIAVGILMLPVALLTSRFGVTLPVHRVLERVDAAYTAVAGGS